MRLFRGAAKSRRAMRLAAALVVGAGVSVVAAQAAPAADNAAGSRPGGATVGRPVHADTSPALRDIPSSGFGNGRIIRPEHEPPSTPTGGSADPVVQSTTSGSATPSASQSFEGVGQGFTGPAGTFNVQYAPPDTNGDVGPNNYVQIVNVGLAVFDKTGKVLLGPIPTNTIFKGFGGGCETNNDGDATVKYDRLANRWLISQFSVSTTPYLQCLAVSTTGDPTGSYNRFSYTMPNFPDYPKLGIWSDGYYTTFNMFNGNTFVGAEVCSYNRAALIASQVDVTAASQVCVSPSGAASILPSDIDGTTAPPAGSPNYLMSYGTNSLNLWRFDVNWSSPAAPSSTLSSKISIPVAAFTAACNGGTCIPQSGTSEKLDSLADRMMYRLAYRNQGGAEHLVVSHAVNPGAGNSAVRWYEIRNPNGTPSVYQQGTYNPDSSYRWMSSAAMDGSGNIAVGYSVSSGSMNPAIRYAARQSTDALGTLGSEVNLISGTGSQTLNLSRWGDYSSMAVDPSDDCTFWYTSEYLTSNGTWNWHTRIGTFKLPNCGSSPDFSVSLSPTSQAVDAGTTASYTATVTPLNGYTGTVDLTSTPTGITPASVSLSDGQPHSATLNINTTGMQPGPSSVSVTGTDSVSTSLTHTVTGTLTINAPDFSVALSPGGQTVTQGGTANYSATITSLHGFVGTVSLSSSPSGVTPTAVTLGSGGSANATLSFSTAGMPVGANPVSVTGTAGSLTHTASSSVTVSDFTVALSPASQSVTQGGTANYTVTVTPVSGYTGTVNLSPSSGATVSPTSVGFTNGSPSSATATLSIATTSSTATGPSTVTVTGTDSVVTSLAHTANASLTVNAPPVGDFGVSASPTSATVTGGGSASYTITIAPSGGFTGTVSLTTSAPGNVKRSLSPTSVVITSINSQTSTLTASSTKKGTFTITVTATSGSLTHTASVTLTRR